MIVFPICRHCLSRKPILLAAYAFRSEICVAEDRVNQCLNHNTPRNILYDTLHVTLIICRLPTSEPIELHRERGSSSLPVFSPIHNLTAIPISLTYILLWRQGFYSISQRTLFFSSSPSGTRIRILGLGNRCSIL